MRLAQPAHPRAEKHEHRQADGDGDERTVGLMHHDFIYDHLGAQGRGEADELDEERSEQHVAPDALVPNQLRPEPAEAELRSRRCAIANRDIRGGLVSHEEHVVAELLLERSDRRRLRRLAAGDEVEQALSVTLDQERGLGLTGEKTDARVCRPGKIALARPEPERA